MKSFAKDCHFTHLSYLRLYSLTRVVKWMTYVIIIYVQWHSATGYHRNLVYTKKDQQYPLLWNVCGEKYLAYYVCCFDCKAFEINVEKVTGNNTINMKHRCLTKEIGACTIQFIGLSNIYEQCRPWTNNIIHSSELEDFQLFHTLRHNDWVTHTFRMLVLVCYS